MAEESKQAKDQRANFSIRQKETSAIELILKSVQETGGVNNVENER